MSDELVRSRSVVSECFRSSPRRQSVIYGPRPQPGGTLVIDLTTRRVLCGNEELGVIVSFDDRYLYIRESETGEVGQYVIDALVEVNGEPPRLRCFPELNRDEMLAVSTLAKRRQESDESALIRWSILQRSGNSVPSDPDEFVDPDHLRYLERCAQDLE